MQQFQLLLSEPGDGVLVLSLSGEVDMATAGTLREASRTAAASQQYQHLVFDLTQLRFMDSTGLHVLTEAHRAMTAAGRKATIVCEPGNLRKIFEMTGLDHLLNIVGERTAALAVAA